MPLDEGKKNPITNIHVFKLKTMEKKSLKERRAFEKTLFPIISKVQLTQSRIKRIDSIVFVPRSFVQFGLVVARRCIIHTELRRSGAYRSRISILSHY